MDHIRLEVLLILALEQVSQKQAFLRLRLSHLLFLQVMRSLHGINFLFGNGRAYWSSHIFLFNYFRCFTVHFFLLDNDNLRFLFGLRFFFFFFFLFFFRLLFFFWLLLLLLVFFFLRSHLIET